MRGLLHLDLINLKKMSLVVVENFINGHFEPSEKYIDSYEPGNGKVWAKIPDSDQITVDKAVQAAKAAFESSWKRLSVDKRAGYLMKAADILESKLDGFALAESRDQVLSSL